MKTATVPVEIRQEILRNWIELSPSAGSSLRPDERCCEQLFLQKRNGNGNGKHSGAIAGLSQHIIRLVKESVIIDRQKEFAKKCQEIRTGNNMFKKIKRVSNLGRFQRLPDVLIDGDWATSDRRELAEFFGSNFKKVMKPRQEKLSIDHLAVIRTHQKRVAPHEKNCSAPHRSGSLPLRNTAPVFRRALAILFNQLAKM